MKSYVGADMSLEALQKAKLNPKNQKDVFSFELFDAVHFPLRRKFDLIVFRDVAEQLSPKDLVTALLNFKNSGRYSTIYIYID